jgi:glycosyltransferase involved in cell wall biosynthesis
MKIAYVTPYDSSDLHAWSGLGNHVLRALQNSGFQIECIGNLRNRYTFVLRVKKVLYSMVLSKNYHRDREPISLRDYAAQVENALANICSEIVFSPGTIPIAYLRTEKPIIFWTGSTFAGMIDFYPDYSNLCAETIRDGNRMEQLALSKCRLAIYASEWAANTAIQNYDVDPAKVKVVPWGANVNGNRNMKEIEIMLNSKNIESCKLLFVGVEWFRKGGDIALSVADTLNQRGIRAELHVVGCNPPGKLPAFVKQHGFISKKTEAGRNLMDKLMTEAHFLIVPSRAECFGVVFAEASSYGLPSLATNVGGIPSAIRDGKNGQTFSLDVDPNEYCDFIERLMSEKEEYTKLALSSFREYSERLNWASSGEKVHELIQEYCAS